MEGLYRHYKGELYTVLGEAGIVEDSVKDKIMLEESELYTYKGMANHTETLERLAIYKGSEGYYIVSNVKREDVEDVVLYYDREGTRWVRPKEMFLDKVDVEGRVKRRFEKV